MDEMTAEERWIGVEDVAKHLGVNKALRISMSTRTPYIDG